MAKVVNGRIVSCYTDEEIAKQKMAKQKKEDDIMSDSSNELLLESLRVNLEKVQKEKMELESKEGEIRKQIDKITQGE